MTESDRFKTTLFGGFKKQDVLNQIDHIMNDYDKKLKELQTKIDTLELENSALQDDSSTVKQKLRQLIVQHQELRNKFGVAEETHQIIISEKNARIDELELQNRQLKYKHKALEERLQKYADIKLEQQDYIQKATQQAQEKTNKIILEAKQKVEKAYSERMNEAEKHAQEKIRQACTEAESILETASAGAQAVLLDTKQQLEVAIAKAQAEADGVLKHANHTAKKLLTHAAQSAAQPLIEQKGAPITLQIHSFDDLETMQKDIELEVGRAIRKIQEKREDILSHQNSVQNASDDSSNDRQRYKKALHNFFHSRSGNE